MLYDRFRFLVFFFFFFFFLSVMRNVSVIGLAGWLAVFIAWPTIGISDRIFGRGNFLVDPSNQPPNIPHGNTEQQLQAYLVKDFSTLSHEKSWKRPILDK